MCGWPLVPLVGILRCFVRTPVCVDSRLGAHFARRNFNCNCGQVSCPLEQEGFEYHRDTLKGHTSPNTK